LLLVL
jgi:hypothetical protein